MEAQIHQLEKEAYCAVLRAFKAQADAITWVFAFCPFFMPMLSFYIITFPTDVLLIAPLYAS